MGIFYTREEMDLLSGCSICPRNCGVNRLAGETGYCGTGAGFHISSICIHRGEEPVIGGSRGICNIFFTGCNMRCMFCQNQQISPAHASVNQPPLPLEKLLDSIENILNRGIGSVGFVSPSHVLPQIRAIIRGLHSRGRRPSFVWNTNAYDRVETIRALEGLIDVYLPDFKYLSPDLSEKYSDAPDYPTTAAASIKEMFRQKGSTIITGEDGQALSGLVIRLLVLPGHNSEAIAILRYISDHLSTDVGISLMSQYHPCGEAFDHPGIGRTLHYHEYTRVVNEFHRLGFRKGWLQEMDSPQSYLPDFTHEHPFEGI